MRQSARVVVLVALDPMVVEVAKRFFDVREDQRLG